MNHLGLRASCSQKFISICMISSFLNVICKIFRQRLHIHIEYWRYTQISFCGIPIDLNTKTCVLVRSLLFAKFVIYSYLFQFIPSFSFLIFFFFYFPSCTHSHNTLHIEICLYLNIFFDFTSRQLFTPLPSSSSSPFLTINTNGHNESNSDLICLLNFT